MTGPHDIAAARGAVIRGFAGKVPVRGDFVHAGLPLEFTDPWHDWQAIVIAGSREVMGGIWLDAFLEAPVWRFVLSPGLCGKRAVIGLIMPSVDKVGRYFPLTFAALPEAPPASRDMWRDWLDDAEALGRRALDDDVAPDQLMPPPCPEIPAGSSDMSGSFWWTEGGPRVAAAAFTLPALPDPARFASMLGHSAPPESAS